jgi:hypothetical protein
MGFFTIFVAMMKEEWRMHSTIFGNLGFGLMPLMMVFFSFVAALLLPIFRQVLPLDMIILFCHLSFVFLGVTIGAFGLLGREAMNRRFGQASFIAYSSRSLPVSERVIMTNFFMKETFYYFILWVLPPIIGFGIASAFNGISLYWGGLLLISLSLSFLTGLAGVFFLSTIYAHSLKGLGALMVLLSIAVLWIVWIAGMPVSSLIPPLLFFYSPSVTFLGVSLLTIVFLATLAIWFVKVDFPESTRQFINYLNPLKKCFFWAKYPHFMAKDLLDMKRSEGGLAKIIFSFVFPVFIILMLLEVLLLFIPGLNVLAVFAILLAAFATTIYNWLTEFDSFNAYSFLPLTVGDVIQAKMQSYIVLNIIPVVVLLIGAVSFGQFQLLLPTLVAFACLSLYAVAATIYVGGLNPSIMLYNSSTLLAYIVLIAPVLLVLIFLSLPNPLYILISITLLPAALHLLKLAKHKWQEMDQPMF